MPIGITVIKRLRGRLRFAVGRKLLLR